MGVWGDDFFPEDMTEDEIDEMIDAALLESAEEIEADEQRTSIVNPLRIRQLAAVYEKLRRAAAGKKGIGLDVRLHEPFRSMGYIELLGRQISLPADTLLRCASAASNFHVSPRTDGNVSMLFTFHGLTVPVE